MVDPSLVVNGDLLLAVADFHAASQPSDAAGDQPGQFGVVGKPLSPTFASMLKRTVIPELLDHLPADDPHAMRSRRDLRRINFLMGNERWIRRTLTRDFPKPSVVASLKSVRATVTMRQDWPACFPSHR